MNEPEELADTERHAQRLRAEVAASMLRYPRFRWLFRPFHVLARYIERKIDEALKEDGCR